MLTIPESLIQWLYTNAPAAWLSAIVATVTCAYVLWTRKRPSQIIVQDIYRSSLVRVWPSVKKKIKLTFDDQPITTLSQIDLKVFNKGSEVIKNASFVIALPKDSKILDVLFIPQDETLTKSIKNNTVTISISHLNSARDHNQVISASILVDGKSEPLKVTGSGEGWSTHHLSLPTEKQTAIRLVIFNISLVFCGVVYIRFLDLSFGISPFEISIRAILATVPFVLGLIAVITFGPRWLTGAFKSPRRVFVNEDEIT